MNKATNSTNLVESALKRFPRARRIAVENFTSNGTSRFTVENMMNLELDTRLYGWNAATVSAITYILKKNTT